MYSSGKQVDVTEREREGKGLVLSVFHLSNLIGDVEGERPAVR